MISESDRSSSPFKLLAEIRRNLAEVNQTCIEWDGGIDRDEEERVSYLIESAFESSLVLMEAIGKPETRSRIITLYEQARKNPSETGYARYAGEVYSVWSYRLSLILDPIEKINFQLNKDIEEPLYLIERILNRLANVERALQQRYASRQPFVVNDEYDLQDLLRSLLSLYFDDISAEDPGPKFAGSSTRVDLLLRKEKIVIELKKTRNDTTEAALGRELKLDIVDYNQRPNCEALVILIDDIAARIKNPQGFAADLKKVEQDFRVEVYILTARGVIS
jgi:hypothetical protein